MSAIRIGLAAAASCALLACSVAQTPWLVWNATPSAPVGLYAIATSATLHKGDLVLASPSPSVARLAASRGYLPLGVPLVKHVAALSGDRVCGNGHAVFVDGRIVAIRQDFDRDNRPLPMWGGCRKLGASDVLLLNAAVAQSFDGRYFGPTSTTSIIGKLVPLWTH